jgi:hypothetical protein
VGAAASDAGRCADPSRHAATDRAPPAVGMPGAKVGLEAGRGPP